ncbi:response regulator [Paenibacillus sp. LHD-117]|uniref:response regulator transcription factor n=1 Tax=Paenibacillus sp. LHD-117 TaxID=3071412 RepID=UPI0027DEDD43|nr:response regulator [Paenibacillus sp. LHD-117]MDQ6417950.1 response regulator [Paenibacillus sp. LHD-117]
MYRLLVVDNEPIIVESVLDLLQRTETIELDICGAYSSIEALRLLETTKFDIVLTDIRMPGMSGLELHREILKRWPWCKVIFLSGYDDFAFIQEVIRNGGVDYLLKTEGNGAIIQAVQKAVQALNDTIEKDNLIRKSKEKLQHIQPYLQKELLLGLVRGETNARLPLEKPFEELNVPLGSKAETMTVIGRIDEWSGTATSVDQSLLLFAVRNIAEEYLSASTLQVSFDFDHRTKLAWFIQPKEVGAGQGSVSPELRQRSLGFIHGAFEMIQMTCKQMLKLSLSFAAGNDYRDWSDIPEQFEHLQLLLSHGLGLGHELLLQERRTPELEPSAIDRELRKQLGKLKVLQTLLDNGQRDQFFVEYGSLMQFVAASSPQSASVKTEIYFTLVSMFMSYLNRWGVQEEIGKHTNLGKMTMLDCHHHWMEVVDYFYALADLLFAHKMSGQGLQENDVIRQVQQYVNQNLAGDLSLNRIGEVVGHNPSYLSRLYKQITSEGLSDYIMAARVAKATELLQENRLKIHDISKAVGFLSDQSFYRFFRKATGVTPQECRENAAKSTDASE